MSEAGKKKCDTDAFHCVMSAEKVILIQILEKQKKDLAGGFDPLRRNFDETGRLTAKRFFLCI